MMNGARIWQPDEGLAYSFETTYSEDTQRLITGELKSSPLFTVEQLGYTATDVPASEASRILQIIARGQEFQLYYYSAIYGAWRTAPFYVGRGNLNFFRLTPGQERVETLSFNMTGIQPI